MPLHEFKTQVLLLHSERSTLDTLSSGFGAGYTVHCATSGSEALNTLMETPINVIVSAQDLPGMSGLEALREAKKRSPETIGILLAGNAGDDLEALVGDKEVFQVVRGNVTNDAILELVEDATQQVRLTTLAESANDTAANVDDSQSEHIVMETADNGASIITDMTGRMRALTPATAVGSRAVDLLVLTKDEGFLATIKESARDMHTVHYAATLAEAVETIKENKVGVAVVDAAMVGERVEQLTQHLRKASARLVSVVAGRRDDGEMLMDLINRGKVYRFLMKPVSPGRARLAIEASVKHHLEAPDAAFKTKSGTADTPAPPPKPTAKPAHKPASRSTPKPTSKPASGSTPKPASMPSIDATPGTAGKSRLPSAAPEKPPASASAPRTVPPLGSAVDSGIDSIDVGSPVRDGLTDAFDESDSKLTETVAGLIGSVGQKLSGDKNADDSLQTKSRRQSDATRASSGLGGSLPAKPLLLGIGAVFLAAVAGTTFLFMSGSGDDTMRAQTPDEQAPLGATATPESTAVVEAPAGTQPLGTADQLVEEARQARDAGQLFEPDGDNAIELYAAAIDADPGNAMVTAELEAAIQQALVQVESALLDSRLEAASAALERVGTVDPDNGRLPFLTAQLSQLQLRDHLAAARAAISESRFEDAENSIASARLMDAADGSEIDVVADELTTARSAQRADEAVVMANARLAENELLSPPNDNAHYYFQLALSIDPENTAASQGISVIASKLALQARSEIDNGDLDSAEALIDEALAIDATNSEIAAAVGALSDKRDAISAQRQRDEAQRRAAAEQRAADARAAAAQAAEAQATIAPEADEPAVETAVEPQPAASTGNAAAPAKADTSAGEVQKAAGPDAIDDAAANEPAVEKLQAKQAAPSQSASVQPAAISTLNRTKYVAPKYPRAAQRRNVSGWVDVMFTVAIDGTVKDVTVRNSEPGETFVNAATRAVEKWEFEPVVENGTNVEKRAAVRMMFALE